MSELTRCNYCNLRLIRMRHPRLTLVPCPQDSFPDGVQVLDGDGKTLSWFAELTDRCVC